MVLNHELIFLIFFKDAGLQSSISFIRKQLSMSRAVGIRRIRKESSLAKLR